MDALRGLFLFADVCAEYRVEIVAGVFLFAGVCALYILYDLGRSCSLYEDRGERAHEVYLYNNSGYLIDTRGYREIDGHVYAWIRLINPMNRER